MPHATRCTDSNALENIRVGMEAFVKQVALLKKLSSGYGHFIQNSTDTTEKRKAEEQQDLLEGLVMLCDAIKDQLDTTETISVIKAP